MRNMLVLVTTATLALTACGSGGTPPVLIMAPVPITGPAPTPVPVPVPVPVPGPAQGAWGDPSTITKAQLNACPLGDSVTPETNPAGVTTCMKGTFNGVVTPGSTVKCSLTIDASGTLSVNVPYLPRSIALNRLTKTYYIHTRTNGLNFINYVLKEYDASFRPTVSIGFTYSETSTNEGLPSVVIGVSTPSETDACSTRIQ